MDKKEPKKTVRARGMRGRGKTAEQKEKNNKRKRNIIIAVVAFFIVVLCVAGVMIGKHIKEKEALEATELQENLESEPQEAEVLLTPVDEGKGQLLEARKRWRNQELVALFPPVGIQALFDGMEPIYPEEADALIAEGKISERKTVKEVLMVLTQEELPAEERTSFLKIESCQINEENTAKVKIEYSVPYVPITDDDYYYLFEMETYETEHGDDYVDRVSKWKEDSYFSVNLNHKSASSRLFSKFVIAVLVDGKYVDISRGHYITNPEAVAKYTAPNPTASSIKGLIVDPAKIAGSEIEDLGVKHAAYNIPVGYILGQTSNPTYPTVYYEYNGKTYAFNGLRIAEFDNIFKSLSNKGVIITAVILNDKNGAYPQLIHPNANGGSAPYYMFNAANEAGCEYLEAVATFLANRYSGSGRGKISNWVIGNEINARQAWNYMDYTSVEAYSQEYAKAFRIFYNGIKSVNAGANVYISLDQLWNRNLSSTDAYDAKDVLDAFNAEISLKGNIDWGLAHHPYPVPLTWPKFWAMPSNYKAMNLVRNNVDTPYITVQNIHVLTDYMNRAEMLNPDGQVRSIALTEVGFGSDHGEELQAAAFAYAYKIVSNNQHIDMFVLNKQADMAEEIAQGLSMGINRTDGSHKYIYNVFKYIDTSSGEDVIAFAKKIIGISDWSEVITSR